MNTIEKNNHKKSRAIALMLTLLLHVLAIAALIFISQPDSPPADETGNEAVTNVQP